MCRTFDIYSVPTMNYVKDTQSIEPINVLFIGEYLHFEYSIAFPNASFLSRTIVQDGAHMLQWGV